MSLENNTHLTEILAQQMDGIYAEPSAQHIDWSMKIVSERGVVSDSETSQCNEHGRVLMPWIDRLPKQVL